MHIRRKPLAATCGLIAVTALWGYTFVVVKQAILQIPPLQFLALRFALGAIVLLAAFPRSTIRGISKALGSSAAVGSALAVGYAFQTLGLRYTGATKSALITGLTVVMTPVLAVVVLKRKPSAVTVLAVAMSAAGLALLTIGPTVSFNLGDALTLVTALAFAAHIVLLGRYSPICDARQLAFGQIAFSTIAFALISLTLEDWVAPSTSKVWWALAVTGIGATAVAFLVMTWAQQFLSPTKTAIVVAMEPVFGTLAGYTILSERLSIVGWTGAALMFGAILFVTLRTETGRRDT